MKKTVFTLSLAFAALLFLSNQNGALPENTGAPSEQTCGRSQCHNTTPNTGSSSVSISYNNGDTTYNADSVRLVRVKINNPTTAKNGFQILALDANNQNVGTWTLAEPTKTKIVNGISFPARRYVTHTLQGNKQSEWTINWKAPATNAGNITFYASGLASNNSNGSTGDRVYTTKTTISFAAPTSSTNDPDPNPQFALTPNPATDFLKIKNPQPGVLFSIEIFEKNGRRVRRVQLGGDEFQTVNIAELASGLYFLKIENGKKRVVEKLVVL